MSKELGSKVMTPGQKFASALALRETQFINVMAPALRSAHGSAEDGFRTLRTYALLAFNRSPILANCTPESLMRAWTDAAVIGLLPGSPLNEAAVIPFKNRDGKFEAKFIPQYGGLVTVARRSGFVVDAHAYAVHENDEFDIDYGRSDQIHHRPAWKTGGGKLLAAWAKITLLDPALNGNAKERTHYEFVPGEEILKVKAMALAKMKHPAGPWIDWEEEKWRITALKRGLKYVPKSVKSLELAHAIRADNEAEADFEDAAEREETITVAEAKPVESETKAVASAEIIVTAPASTETPKGARIKQKIAATRKAPATGAETDPDWQCNQCKSVYKSHCPDKCRKCGHGGFSMGRTRLEPFVSESEWGVRAFTAGTASVGAPLGEDAFVVGAQDAESGLKEAAKEEAQDGIGQILDLSDLTTISNDRKVALRELISRAKRILEILPEEIAKTIVRDAQLAKPEDIEKMGIPALTRLLQAAREEAVGE